MRSSGRWADGRRLPLGVTLCCGTLPAPPVRVRLPERPFGRAAVAWSLLVGAGMQRAKARLNYKPSMGGLRAIVLDGCYAGSAFLLSGRDIDRDGDVVEIEFHPDDQYCSIVAA